MERLPTFDFKEMRRTVRHENYCMPHITFLSMKYPEVYIEPEREYKIRQRQIEINNYAREFRELATPRYMNR